MTTSSRANIFNTLALVAVCATAAFHWVGVELSYYWIYQGVWDIPTHILGGLTISFLIAAISIRLNLSLRYTLILTVVVVGVVGVAWELWELLMGLEGRVGGYWFDTSKDLCNDLLGGLCGWFIFIKLSR